MSAQASRDRLGRGLAPGAPIGRPESRPQTLRSLERDGLVHRHGCPTIPPRIEYELIPLGQSLEDAIAVVRQWACTHMDEITASRNDYDRQSIVAGTLMA
ncbi:MAG TPA: helix-turn-helix domain-containing protein [Amycolatopsis sp.]|nr:helix-turn-helix domain-containing protein [Amycolatopsis sp.]